MTRHLCSSRSTKRFAASLLFLALLGAAHRLAADDSPQALEAACNAGDGTSCRRLGALYENGRGVARDVPRAVDLYRRGCESKDMLSCSYYGDMFHRGTGVARDDKQAVVQYNRGCSGGNAEACSQLGYMYLNGWGLPRDRAHAAELFDQSCSASHPDACRVLGWMFKTGFGVDPNPQAAAARYAKACALGNGEGCLQFGYCYEVGIGVARDLSRSVEFYRKACDRSNAQGCTYLAYMYENGRGVGQDTPIAQSLYSKACNGGYAAACTSYSLIQSVPAAVAEQAKPNRNCAEVIKTLGPFVRTVATSVTEATKPAYWALTRCAWASGYWDTVRYAGERAAAAKWGDAAAIPYALIRLGKYKEAEEAIANEQRVYGENARLAWVRGVLQDVRGDYAAVVASETEALRLVDATNSRAKGHTGVDALTLRARAYCYLGQFREAERDVEEVAKLPETKARVESLQEMLFRAKRDLFIFKRVVQQPVPLGTYHLFGSKASAAGSLVRLDIINLDSRTRELRVEVQIAEVTQKTVGQVVLAPKAAKTLYLTPPLALSFDINAIQASRKAELEMKVVELVNGSERVIRDEAMPITLQPRDYLPLGKKLEENAYELTPEYIAAWVTPNTAALENILTAAKKRLPSNTFAGEQQETLSQVRAIWQELQSRGVSYVLDPMIQSDENFYQRIRLPAEALRSTNTQCLEGSILVASVLEAIGLRPVIVIVPGHAYVGWHSSAGDGLKGAPVFVETTWIHDHSFDEALTHATSDFYDQLTLGAFKSGSNKLGESSHVLDIQELRAKGFTPQPAAQ